MKIKGLTIISVLACLIVIWINFIEYKINTVVFLANKSEKINSIIENLCLSYIAGYIFYFLNIYLVEQKEKRYILPYVSKKIDSIIRSNVNIVKTLKQGDSLERVFPSVEEFKELLSKEKFDLYNNGNHPDKTIWEFFQRKRINTIKGIDKVLLSGKYIDEELKLILFNLLESNFLNTELELKEGYINNDSSGENIFYKNMFGIYFAHLKKLEIYYQEKLVKYRNLL